MSISQAIAPHLPYLRRFARALAGTQAAGDAYVAATLEVLIEDPSLFDSKIDPRVALFRTFTGLWNSVGVNLKPDIQTTASTPADRKLESITPLPRQAFLLSAVEGFPVADIAAILGLDKGEVEKLIDQAGREIAAQVATDVLVIEDEPMIAMDLEGIVEGLGHRVMGVARTHAEAVKAIANERPGLVLADIQLADGSSGLDAVNEMLGIVPGAGDLHHRLSRPAVDRRASRAGLPDHQALSARHGEGDRQSGALLRAAREVARPAGRGLDFSASVVE